MVYRIARHLFVVMAVLSAALTLTGGNVANAVAQEDVVWPELTLVRRYGGLNRPINVAFVDDGTGRIFVGEHAGRVRLIKNGQLLATPILDISTQISCCWEHGMIGMAFPRDFAQKQYFYIYYTDVNYNSVISRFWMSQGDPDRADPNSEQIILFVPQTTSVHKGGQLAFGPDGYLYIALGDGRFATAPDINWNAQDPSNLYGKILRINTEVGVVRPDRPTRAPAEITATRKVFVPMVGMTTSPRYLIPPDNPFASVPGKRPEIWVMGLRNPYRFSFDRQTGDLFIGDVGQLRYEEINFKPAGLPAGQNFGWPYLEGTQCYAAPNCNPQLYVGPIAGFGHAEQQCAVVTGSMYRGPGNPSMRGVFFFADFCTGRIWGVKRAGTTWEMSPVLLDPDFSITNFVEDLLCSLYAVDWRGGRILQVQETTAE